MSNKSTRDTVYTGSRYCSFCGRGENQVNFLIPAPTGIYICDFCVDACEQLIYENTEASTALGGMTLDSLPRPQDIKKTLDEIGSQYGVSRERIRQIENRAIAKLKKLCKNKQLTVGLKNYFGG